MIEAAVERLDVKRDLFSAISQAAPPHVILTTNSSTVVSSKLADATELHKEIPGFIANRILGGDVRVGQSVADRLSGTVEVDETYTGGEEPGLRSGRAPGKKVLTGIAVEVKEPKGIGRCRMARWTAISSAIDLLEL